MLYELSQRRNGEHRNGRTQTAAPVPCTDIRSGPARPVSLALHQFVRVPFFKVKSSRRDVSVWDKLISYGTWHTAIHRVHCSGNDSRPLSRQRRVWYHPPFHSLFWNHGTALNWFKSYLSDRLVCVKCYNDISGSHQSCYGIPQGSVLGPLLFTLYTTPLSPIISSLSLNHHLYADDTQLFISFQPDMFTAQWKHISLTNWVLVHLSAPLCPQAPTLNLLPTCQMVCPILGTRPISFPSLFLLSSPLSHGLIT